MKSIKILRNLIEQIERGNLKDDNNHEFKMNKAYIDAKEYLDEVDKNKKITKMLENLITTLKYRGGINDE